MCVISGDRGLFSQGYFYLTPELEDGHKHSAHTKHGPARRDKLKHDNGGANYALTGFLKNAAGKKHLLSDGDASVL